MISSLRDIAAYAAVFLIGVLNGILSGFVYLLLGIAGILINSRLYFGRWMKAVFEMKKEGKK